MKVFALAEGDISLTLQRIKLLLFPLWPKRCDQETVDSPLNSSKAYAESGKMEGLLQTHVYL